MPKNKYRKCGKTEGMGLTVTPAISRSKIHDTSQKWNSMQSWRWAPLLTQTTCFIFLLEVRKVGLAEWEWGSLLVRSLATESRSRPDNIVPMQERCRKELLLIGPSRKEHKLKLQRSCFSLPVSPLACFLFSLALNPIHCDWLFLFFFLSPE